MIGKDFEELHRSHNGDEQCQRGIGRTEKGEATDGDEVIPSQCSVAPGVLTSGFKIS